MANRFTNGRPKIGDFRQITRYDSKTSTSQTLSTEFDRKFITASAFVCTMFAVMQRCSRVHQRQLILVYCAYVDLMALIYVSLFYYYAHGMEIGDGIDNTVRRTSVFCLIIRYLSTTTECSQ